MEGRLLRKFPGKKHGKKNERKEGGERDRASKEGGRLEGEVPLRRGNGANGVGVFRTTNEGRELGGRGGGTGKGINRR